MPYTARTHQLSQSLLYHVYNRANGRSEIFHDLEDYQKFLSLLSGYSKEHYLLSCGRYIERNPVKAKMIDFAEDYPYSSAAFYVYGKQDGLTKEDPALETFGKEPIQQRQSYKEFLEAFDSDDDESFEKLEKPQGSQEFLKRLIREKGLFLPRRRGRARK